jgi:formylglycine-generating enzyme required for sulfatase activity
LPTNAELEYATRAGALTSRYYGETEELLAKYACYDKNSQQKTWPVGSLKPNDFGLFDMRGNVNAWCQDRWEKYPPGRGEEPKKDREDIDIVNNQDYRVQRGGSFADRAALMRSANRYMGAPLIRLESVGFRPARTIAP